MATRKQKEALVDALKFTPRDVRITLWGYGGEVAIGRISEAAYDYWSQHEDDLSDFVYDWDNESEDVPADAQFCTDGCWYDVDDLAHESGVEFNEACGITVTDEMTGETLWESNLDPVTLEEKGVEVSCWEEVFMHTHEPGECFFMGQSVEKGTFFDGVVRITRPFDHTLLGLSYGDYEGWLLGNGVTYDGEDVEGMDGYSTTGKSSEFRVHRNEEQAKERSDYKKELDEILADIPILQGEEMWASEAIDSAPETWNDIPLTKWWPGDFEPYHRGEYEVFEADNQWPFPQRARWTGKKWLLDGKQAQVKQWRGLTQPA